MTSTNCGLESSAFLRRHKCQNHKEDGANFCGLLIKAELYIPRTTPNPKESQEIFNFFAIYSRVLQFILVFFTAFFWVGDSTSIFIFIVLSREKEVKNRNKWILIHKELEPIVALRTENYSKSEGKSRDHFTPYLAGPTNSKSRSFSPVDLFPCFGCFTRVP